MGKLIRLELFNFKSYKGHHVLLFGDSYFTSIIGPNGSGKSNSMDAISFVLGIKSSHLRSTHLRDLIYRGRVLKTSKINVDGTATEGAEMGNPEVPPDEHNYGEVVSDEEEAQDTQTSTQRDDPKTAWVMAVYEDDAGDEQLWRRSITSAGQSEYRINNRVVNARQYNEALEAENILIKARNFLVFQGDVEAIASQSPKDLTRLIEQISGSLEFKAEYDRLEEESERAADEQATNHNQRRAINAEIRQFTDQKKEADSYARTVEERDQAIVTHVLWKLYHFQRVMEESEQEIQRHQHELKEQKREVGKYEQQMDAARKEQAKAAQNLAKVEKNLRTTEKELEIKENALVPVDEKIAISNQNLAKYRKRVEDITKERDGQSATVDQLQKNLNATQRAQRKWAEDFENATRQQGRQLDDADLQEYNRLKADVNRRTASDQTTINNLGRQRKTDGETVNSLKSKVDDCEKLIERLTSEIQNIRERRDEMSRQADNTSKEIDAKKKEYNSLTSERLRTQQKHTEIDEKLREVLGKLVEADDGRRQTEKERRAKELVSAMKHIFPGVRGRLHELCKPKQKKYDTAVSTVLGRHFDSIVVDSEKTAKECIGYLRDQRAGQATFIPLDTIQVKNVNSNLKGMHKKMRLAIDTIDYDTSVERAMSYACGNAMICDDLETAKYLCYERRVEAKAVTFDGTVIHKGGLMTGGRGNIDKGARKWEDTEVDNLRRLKDKLMRDMAALPQGHKAVTDEEALQGELSGLEQQLIYTRDELNAFDRNIESKERELQFNQAQLDEAQPKYQEQSRSLAGIQKQIEDLEGTVGEVEDSVFEAFCQRLGYADIRAYDAQQGTLQQEAADKRLEFTKQISKLENQLTFERGRLQSTTDRISTIQERIQRDQELIDILEEEKQAMQAEVDDLASRVSTITGTLEQQKARSEEKAAQVSLQRKNVQKRRAKVEDSLKAVLESETELQRRAGRRYALLRKCKIDEIDIPLDESSATLDSLPIDEAEANADEMDVDEDAEDGVVQAPRDYGIVVDFDGLDADLKDAGDEDQEATQDTELEAAISALNAQLSTLAPNMRALDRLKTATDTLEDSREEYEATRNAARETRAAFENIRSQRAELFNKAHKHIAQQILPVYQALTRSAAFPLGGSAYLDTMGADEEAPFLGGTKYHAMPPLKRFRDMEALSGGEKTIAALALLFAIHSFSPSPFFVLDEVDAALDNANVAKVARYIKEHAKPGMQFIVISLKAGLFQESECLVGILRDQSVNSSRAVTLDLRKYRPT